MGSTMRPLSLLACSLYIATGCVSGESEAPAFDLDGKADIDGDEAELDGVVYSMALGAAELAHSEGRGLGRENILTIIDFSLPSNVKRLWVIDTGNDEVLFQERVAHGRNSGDVYNATSFSNIDGSNQSSLGLYECRETGVGGRVGPYVALDGLEPGFNDNARHREIVVHGASYASNDFFQDHNYTGRSLGCPAVRPDIFDALMEEISGGSLLFIYFPDMEWMSSSRYIDGPEGSPWVGTICEPGDDAPCDYVDGDDIGFCFDDGGFCSLDCEGFCPDRYGHATTFCIEDNGRGICVPKAEGANGFCEDIPGTWPQSRERFVGGSNASPSSTEVCLP